MVVPSGLADSLNVPSLLGIAGARGLVPNQHGTTDAAPKHGGSQ